MKVRRAAVSTTVIALLSLAIARGQEPGVADVLQRAGAYVTTFQRQLAGAVTEESYVQDIVENTSFGPRVSSRQPVLHRELKSDLLLVKPEGAQRWIQFRDVFDVDGRPVRDRNDRLLKLFVNPSTSTASQVEQIVGESVRYNIGSILRNFNLPVFALMVLEPSRQRSFTFSRIGAGTPALARGLGVPADAWVIRYQERDHDTMIRTTNDRDLPMKGRFWIDPATGRVLMSELIAEDFALSATIVVTFQPGVLPDLLVPAAMREQYVDRRTMMKVNGEATYGRYRQFQVKVDEKIAPIK